jgi:hypothetical protein
VSNGAPCSFIWRNKNFLKRGKKLQDFLFFIGIFFGSLVLIFARRMNDAQGLYIFGGTIFLVVGIGLLSTGYDYYDNSVKIITYDDVGDVNGVVTPLVSLSASDFVGSPVLSAIAVFCVVAGLVFGLFGVNRYRYTRRLNDE